MKQILALSKPNAICAIHCSTANGFFKENDFFDFAGPFGSAFFLSNVKAALVPNVIAMRIPNVIATLEEGKQSMALHIGFNN